MGCQKEMRICLKTHITTSICKHTINSTHHIGQTPVGICSLCCLLSCCPLRYKRGRRTDMTVGWEIEVRGRGSQQMPPQRDREMEKYTQICRNIHTIHNGHCRKPCTCTPAQPHTCRCKYTHGWLNMRENMHTYTCLCFTLSRTLSHLPSFTLGEPSGLFCLLLLCGPCCGINHYFIFSPLFSVGKVNVS